jgi:hypothetical protein
MQWVELLFHAGISALRLHIHCLEVELPTYRSYEECDLLTSPKCNLYTRITSNRLCCYHMITRSTSINLHYVFSLKYNVRQTLDKRLNVLQHAVTHELHGAWVIKYVTLTLISVHICLCPPNVTL